MILSELHTDIQEMVRTFARKELSPEILDEIEESGEFPKRIRDKMGEIGLFGIKIPEEYGGQGLDNLAYVIMLEALCRVSPVASLYANSPNSLSGGPIMYAGTETQKQKYLTPVATGEKTLAFALTEPGAGSDAGGLLTRAERDGDYYVLNGRKTFITMAPLADYAIVYAKTDMSKGTKGISAFIVDMKLPGVSLGKNEHKMGLRGCATSDIVLDNVRVHVSDLLGEENQGFSNAMKTLDGGRLGVAAQSIGAAQGCLDEAISYAKVRKQFGRRIADFQAISFMIADMAAKLAAARELTYSAAVMKDENHPDAALHCSMAKYYTSELCNEIAGKAVQIHGGYGYIHGYKVERFYRDCRVFTIYEGTSQVQQMVIAGNLLK
ncbi:MAG: acyl-CoA dehydrogenase family protein [Oscillospiraceae bacterium]|jgi:alkylation response protein AidB-like acyl-CoA dehydrogenase|nr:acyl-CoA dehydrogenase family protein [Oscillospiraceae bacterium]